MLKTTHSLLTERNTRHLAFLVSALGGLLVITSSGRAQTQVPRVDEPAVAQAIHKYFDPIAETRDISGVIRLERGGKVTEAWFGYADWSKHKSISTNLQFASGSIAKSMIATVILELARQGKLDTGAAVSKYVNEYRYGTPMTLGQVLHHAAGLPRGIPDVELESIRKNGLVSWLNAHPPGVAGRSVYSNVGYDLLALIASRAAGEPYQALVHRMIIEPLSLEHTHLSATAYTDNAARPHQPAPGGDSVMVAPNTHLPEAGALFASAADLARWGRAVRDSEIVSLKESAAAYAGSESVRRIAGHSALWMQGTIQGGGAVVTAFPGTDVVVVIALNLGTYAEFNSENVVSTIAFDMDPGAPPVRPPVVKLTDAHRVLAGDYEMGGIGRFRIHEAEGMMRIATIDGGGDEYLAPAPDGWLVWRLLNLSFAARRDSNGVVTGLRSHLHMIGEQASDGELNRIRRESPSPQ
jgi:CubicO group peptidase (beta-lactamase class C family)